MEHETKKVSIKQLKLTNYRNFANYIINFEDDLISLIGSNGVGKTNILEAISLLAPGKGLRNSKLTDLENYHATYENGWSIKADFMYNDVIAYELITSKANNIAGRNILLNSNKLNSQQSLTKYINIIYLTPAQDSIFIDSKSTRRKFFDRITYNIFSDHLENLHKYDYYIKERMAILSYQKTINQQWLEQVEEKIAILISKITISRVQTIKYLNSELENLNNNYPKAFIFFAGEYEEFYIKHQSEDSLIELACDNLKNNRMIDQEKRITSSGSHKSDFRALFTSKNIDAQFCSTGEQKSLLISLTLAQAKMLKKYNNRTPILLLDEILSHLDQENAHNLLSEIANLSLQCFMTGTNEKLFMNITGLKIHNITL